MHSHLGASELIIGTPWHPLPAKVTDHPNIVDADVLLPQESGPSNFQRALRVLIPAKVSSPRILKVDQQHEPL